MKLFKWLRHSFFILVLYTIGLLEAHYIPRYGLEWLLVALGATAFLAGFWMREHWDV